MSNKKHSAAPAAAGTDQDPIDALFDAIAIFEAVSARLQMLVSEQKLSEDQSVMVQRALRTGTDIVSRQAIALVDRFGSNPI